MGDALSVSLTAPHGRPIENELSPIEIAPPISSKIKVNHMIFASRYLFLVNICFLYDQQNTKDDLGQGQFIKTNIRNAISVYNAQNMSMLVERIIIYTIAPL